MRKTSLVLLVCLLGLFMLTSMASAKEYEIAVVVKIAGIPWFNRMEEGVVDAAKELGVNAYQIGPSEADPALQVNIIEDLIAKGVDAICVVPNDALVLEPVFRRLAIAASLFSLTSPLISAEPIGTLKPSTTTTSAS